MNKRYALPAATRITDFKNALIDYYGAGVTIHYDTAPYLIFSCPAICNKVIKFHSDTYSKLYYGDAWTSGSTITNQVVVDDASFILATYMRYLVLCPNALLIYSAASSDNKSSIIAKLSNNKFALLSMANSSSHADYCKCYLTDTNVQVWQATLSGKFKSTVGTLLTLPIYLQYASGNLVANADNSPAYVMDLQQSPSVASEILNSINFFATKGGDTQYQNTYATYGTTNNAIVAALN